ncbi:MAG: hypothetical protein WBK88_08600 [Methanothrix sp.]
MDPDNISPKVLVIPLLLLAVLAGEPGEAASGPGGVRFAEDYYKVEGGPRIDVSVVNPVFSPGSSGTLRLILANDGVVDRLVPGVVPPGKEAEAAQEMLAEFGCLEASNLMAILRSGGPVEVISGPATIEILGPGETRALHFDIKIDERAEGPVPISLDLEYEHQVDVSFSGGTATPLYLPSSRTIDLILSVEGNPPALGVMGSRSILHPGERGSISLIIRNGGESRALNSTARLVAAPPFSTLADRSRLGDIPPGGVAVARFDVFVEGSARAQEYRIGCEISHDGGITTLSIPVSVVLEEGSGPFRTLILGALLAGGGAAALWLIRLKKSGSPRRRSPILPRR